MAQIDIQVPDIGDFDEVAVIELLVKPGDSVAVDQSLITVESDKASMEIPSSHAGVVTALKVKLGDKVKQGSVILSIEASGAVATAATSLDRSAPAVSAVPATAAVAAPLPHLRQPWLHPWPAGTTAQWMCNAMCWCWAEGPAVIPLHSERQIWA